MIISRTPFRISFFGGGTDYPAWYLNHGGHCISSSINKYCFVTCRNLPPFFDYKYRIRYHIQENRSCIDEIKHPSIRNSIKYANISDSLEIVHSADLPARSGMGSSSAFTVGLLNCLNAIKGQMSTKRELAEGAIYIEQVMCSESVGSQDQIAASFGGINSISFKKSGQFSIEPIPLSESSIMKFSEHMLLCFTGFSRTASVIAKKQIDRIDENEKALLCMMEFCKEALGNFNENTDFKILGKILHEQWQLKKSLTKEISSPDLDIIYDIAVKNGAWGGKLLGAGSGGFMLFMAPKSAHQKIKSSLSRKLFVPFRLESQGSTIIYFNK